MAALDIRQPPLLVQAPNGALIPVDGGDIANPGDQAPIAGADLNDAGQDQPGSAIRAAGSGGALMAANAPQPKVLMVAGKGGPASGALIDHPRQPAPMQDLSTMPDMAAPTRTEGANLKEILGGLFKSSGSVTGDEDAGGMAGVDAMNGAGLGSPPPATSDMPPTPAPAAGGSDQEPGLLERLKTFILGPPKNSTPAPSAPVQTGALPPDAGAAAPAATSGGNGGSDFLSRIFSPIMDKGDPLKDVPPEVMAARYGDNYKAPDWFDRLRADPTRLALLTGGLATMASAARPGQTVGGAIGEGALRGIGGVYEQQMAQREAALAAAKEASEEELRAAQGRFYGDRGGALRENADTNAIYRPAMADAANTRAGAAATTAGARVTDANARQTSADAAMVRAKAYADSTKNPTGTLRNAQYMVENGEAPDLDTAIQSLKGGTTPAQRAALITARERTILGSNLNPSPEDIARAEMQATHEINDTLDMAASTKPADKAGAIPAVTPMPGTAAAKAAGGDQAPGALPAPQKANGQGAIPGNAPPPKKGGPDKAATLSQARNAIKQGANPAAVKKRLQGMGIDPGEL